MKNQTKRINNKKTTTRKSNKKNDNLEDNGKRKGIFNIIGNKLHKFSNDAGEYLTEKGLRLFGLQPIPQKIDNKENSEFEENKKNEKYNEINKETSNLASGILSSAKKIGEDVVGVVDKTSAALVEQVNDVLESPKIENSVKEAVEDTTKISKKLLENVNEKLNNPVLQKEAEIVLDNIGKYAEVAEDAINEPLNKGIDNLNQAGTKAISGLTSGAIKVGTDALAAVPGLGAIIELGKIANDGSKALEQVAEAGKESAGTILEIVKDTNKNIHEGLEKLDEEKNEIDNNFKEINNNGKKISSRINKSLNEFENPFPSSGGNKTRSKFLTKKHKKTKRVRFSI